jgi:hypothetical protein
LRGNKAVKGIEGGSNSQQLDSIKETAMPFQRKKNQPKI